MKQLAPLILLFAIVFCSKTLTIHSQVVINEGSNRNFQQWYDEDGEAKDWIELYNSGSTAIDLYDYSLATQSAQFDQWTFPHFNLNPGEYLIVFCSGKNRFYSPPFVPVVNASDFIPQTGWNQHDFFQPFYWDGVSNIVVNSCSYSNTGYITNSIFNQTTTPYISSIANFQDGSDASCYSSGGEIHNMRPNIQLNGLTIGNGMDVNTTTTYPAPYGNWYWGARNQMLYTAAELQAAGLTAGPINSIAWDVAYTDPVVYTYVNIELKNVSDNELNGTFISDQGNYFHTNFGLSADGETVYLFNPSNEIVDSMQINCPAVDCSQGLFPNGTGIPVLFQTPSAGNPNSVGSGICTGQTLAPLFSLNSGIYNSMQWLTIYDVNNPNAEIHYTTNGNIPTYNDPIYTEPLPIFQSTCIRARAFLPNQLPSSVKTGNYLINVNHTTPIVCVATDNSNLYGDQGIFDHWEQDWEKYAFMEYFDSTSTHAFVFNRQAAMQIDGGAGGSRSNPQHSFRLEMNNSALGGSPVLLPLIPHEPNRAKYSSLYFRNGSNQYLTLPYKDAAQVEMMVRASNGYYSAMRPVTVYLNGQYFGLYEMREKLNEEYFDIKESHSDSTADVLSLSYWYGGMLRGNPGNPADYYQDVTQILNLDPASENYYEQADSLFDLVYYSDYIIGETWMGNADWPGNNIKIYRSDSTDYRWRFATIDLELCLAPNAWTDCNFSGLDYINGIGYGNPFVSPWYKSMQNPYYHDYFINRYADIMNTAYRADRLMDIEQNFFNLWVTEMPNEYQRWGDPWNINGWMNDFFTRHIAFQDDLLCKTETVWNQVQNLYQLPNQHQITLNTIPAQAGKIHINTITPNELPWSGIYFDGLPIQLSAEANEGYLFSHWENNPLMMDTTQMIWNDTLSIDSLFFTAHFIQDTTMDTTVSIIDEKLSTTTLQLFPNPTQDFISLSHSQLGIQHILIYDLNGRLVYQKQIQPSSRRYWIDVKDWDSGMYLTQVQFQDGSRESVRWLKVE
jgi:CotH kinase protein/Fn3 associated/Secretion system C-terminal sorting domain/Lamin Tail Domain